MYRYYPKFAYLLAISLLKQDSITQVALVLVLQAYSFSNNTGKKFFFVGALVFRPFSGVIWGADSEKCIG
jgi:hypothetical protein